MINAKSAPSSETNKFARWVEYFDQLDTDVYAYFGPIERQGYDLLTQSFPRVKKKNALLILGTWGGSPDAGFRVARAMQHHYGPAFSVLVPYFCKSAGTLICIGAYKLYLADRSELGPLDVQLRKQDEMFQQSSSLDIVRGITTITGDALDNFRTYLLDINSGSGMSTKTAADIATKLVVGLYEPIFAQVDPVKVGETSAALSIADNYGRRLAKKSGSLRPDALSRLIRGYPSHSFVIDRSEAKELFKRVERPDPEMDELGSLAQDMLWGENGFALNVLHLNTAFAAAAKQPTSSDGGVSPTIDHDESADDPERTEAAREASTEVAVQGHEGLESIARNDGRIPAPVERDGHRNRARHKL